MPLQSGPATTAKAGLRSPRLAAKGGHDYLGPRRMTPRNLARNTEEFKNEGPDQNRPPKYNDNQRNMTALLAHQNSD